MTLRNLSDKETKTINGGGLINCCPYPCGFGFPLTNVVLYTLENVKNIFVRVNNLISLTP